MKARHALTIREGLAAGKAFARKQAETNMPRGLWVEEASGDLCSQALTRAYLYWRPIYDAARDVAECEAGVEEREVRLREMADPDLSFHQVYAEGGNVRCVTYSRGEIAATLLIHPDRAQSLAGILQTEAARARMKRRGASDGESGSGSTRDREHLAAEG